MHSAAGHDQLHGDFEDLLARVRAASDDPRGNGCSGMYLNPELIHYDPLYYEFLAKVAWDPMTVEPKTFLDDYALRRYGKAPYQPMRRFLGEVVEGLYTREMNIAVYKLTSFQWVWHHAAPWIQLHTIPRLARALATAFPVRERQEGNSLYVNDMVKVTFALLAEIAAWHWHGVHAAYAIGDGDGYDSAAVLCAEAVAWIARIASTREDLNIGRMIERVMSVPGTNRYTPRMIMQGLANWGYCSNDTHEQVANLYLPRMRDYFGKLRASLAARPPVDLKAMMPTLSPTMEEWKERPSSLERTITFDGSTLDGATEAYRWGVASIPRTVREGIPSRPGARRGWSLALATNGSWHEAPVGIRIEGELIESDPANGPTGISMHREFVEMCLWGSVTTAPASGLREVRLQDYPLLTIRYQTEAATGPAMLFAHFQSASGSERRVRIWRTFGPAGFVDGGDVRPSEGDPQPRGGAPAASRPRDRAADAAAPAPRRIPGAQRMMPEDPVSCRYRSHIDEPGRQIDEPVVVVLGGSVAALLDPQAELE